MFAGYEHRAAGISAALTRLSMKSLAEAKAYALDQGVDVEAIVRGFQPIVFDEHFDHGQFHQFHVFSAPGGWNI